MKRLKLLICLLCGVVIAFLFMCARGVFSAQTASERLMYVCDGFFVSGILMFGIGLMGWIAGEGLFDIFGYAVRAGLHHILPGRSRTSVGGFYEYKVSMEEKRKEKRASGNLLLCGGIQLAVSGIMLFFWYRL